jgi:hypothetical protein
MPIQQTLLSFDKVVGGGGGGLKPQSIDTTLYKKLNQKEILILGLCPVCVYMVAPHIVSGEE